MKSSILFITVLILTICTSAQDILYKTDGSEIKAEIIEITLDVIKYRNADQIEGPIFNVPISEVFMIIYEGGEKEVFKNQTTKIPMEELKKQLLKTLKTT